jgi:hypothetical protein
MSNTPVANLAAALSLDVSGYAIGVRQAETLSKRLAKAQAEALGGGAGVRALGGADLRQRVIRAQEQRVRASVPADTQGPVRLREEQINAEITTIMAARQREAQERVRLTQQAADERLRTEQQISQIRARQNQIRGESKFDIANPFQQQVLAAQKLNQLLVQRRTLQRGTVEFAQAELAVTQQIARVRAIRDNLTVGAEGFRKIGNTAADSQKKFARFGLAMQQTGYQVQDFAVQVASGTNALVALSQQGSQLLGFFGGMKGALAGAVLSVGILAYRMYQMKTGTEAAAQAAEKAKTAFLKLRDAQKAVENLRLGQSGVESRDLGEAQKQRAEALADIVLREKRLAELQKTLDEVAPVDRFSGKRDLPLINRGGVEKMLKAEVSLQEQITKQKTIAAEAESTILEIEKRREKELTDFENQQFLASATEQRRALQESIELGNYAFMLEQKAAEKRKEEAEAIKDQLDPLRAKRRELEKIRDLESRGLLDEGTADRFSARLREQIERSLKLPDSFSFNSGGQSTGGFVGTSTAAQQLDLQKKALDALVRISNNTALMAGAN